MRRLLFALALLGLPACDNTPAGSIDNNRTGMLLGIAYVDRDGDGRLSQVDGPARGVAAALVLSTGDTVARATAGNDGIFVMSAVPVGNYTLVARLGTLGDTLVVQRIDTASVSVAAGDTVRRSIRVGYPTVSSSEMRTLAVGRRVLMEGIALNAWAAWADSTLHVRDSAGTARGVRVQPSAVQPGDSIRLIGVTGVVNARPVLIDVVAILLAGGRTVPPPDSVATVSAAAAVDGTRQDGLVRVAGTTVLDTATVGNYRRVGISDGSGRLELMLRIGLPWPVEAAQPGAIVAATGILVPATSGTAWTLRPRTPADVSASFPTFTVAQLRSMPLGQRVWVEGIALNAWGTFSDATLHLQDRTGAIRVANVPQSALLAGDSLRVLGTTGMRDGRLTVVDAAVTVAAAARGVPAVDSVSTAVAAAAAGGARADGHVRIGGAVIRDTATVAGDRVMGVDDGTGRVEVVLSRFVTFDTGPWVPGGTFRGAGVLKPAPSGSAWRMYPRERSEAAISFPTVTVADARAAEPGRRVILEGQALNALATFGDSTVHLLDRTGTLRAIRVVGSNVLAGDSVRLLGTVDARNGRPVLTAVTVTFMSRTVPLPVPDSVSTRSAAQAAGGARDAGVVRVSGIILGGQQTPDGDVVLTVDDGSGRLEVVFDRRISFPAGAYVPGAIINATGLLIPATAGAWQLKPRSGGEVNAQYPTVTIAEARSLPAGRTVYVHGLALNGWVTFGDATVHLYDRKDAIRAINVPQSAIFAGDSIRILGTISTRNGQPVLVGSSAAVLLTGVGIPAPDSVTTLRASGASGGTLDAHQVATAGRVLRIDTIAPNERRLHITDGSGELKVLLDRDVGFPVGAYRANDWIRVRGVLVPGEEGTSWELKPRTLSDIAVSQAPPDPSGGTQVGAADGGSAAATQLAAPPAGLLGLGAARARRLILSRAGWRPLDGSGPAAFNTSRGVAPLQHRRFTGWWPEAAVQHIPLAGPACPGGLFRNWLS
jgi:hypothetical protein